MEPPGIPGVFPDRHAGRPSPPGAKTEWETRMNSIIYLVGLVVVVLFILGLLGLR